MIISRRNLLYGLGSIGITAAVPALSGCCSRRHRWGDPNEVRVLLEGAWLLRSTANSSDTMQAVHCLFGNHQCYFGLWSENGPVDHTGTARMEPLNNDLPWTMNWAQKPKSTFQTVVDASKKACAVYLDDPTYTINPDLSADFILDLPTPECANYGLPYAASRVLYNSNTLTPHIAVVLHYRVPRRGYVLFQTGANFPELGNQLRVLGGNDVIFRMMYQPGMAKQMGDEDPCTQVKAVFGNNVKRIVDRKSQKQNPSMQLILPDLRLNSVAIGNISTSELGDTDPGESITCPTEAAQITTLANCLGGNITLGG